MCGIAGFLGGFEPSLLERMSARIAHRGPDDCGELYDREAGLGFAHRRLSIIDLSPAGHQPMESTDGKAVIIYNGELYNYRELRTELLTGGYPFRSHSDTEVLLALYLRDGEDMLKKLNGIFAFALWDREKKRLFLARDGVGVKPLYYAETELGFLFASEIKALLAEPSLSRALDYEALISYLTYLWCPAPRTLLAAVKKLEPGHGLLVKEGKVEKKWQFYDLPYQQRVKPLDEASAVQKCRELVSQAVERQLVSDVPVGAFLSGGLDSSAVVAMARRFIRDKPIQCFTIACNEGEMEKEGFADDLPYAKKVAGELGVSLNVVKVESSMLSRLEEMIWHLDEPQADPAALHVLFISELARQHGIKVVLSGAGGDDIFTGYRRHFALMQERYWRRLPSALRYGLRALPGALPLRGPLKRRCIKALEYAHLDDDERLVSYFYWTAPSVASRILSADVRNSLGRVDPSEPLLASLAALPPGIAPLNRMLYLEGKHFLADHNLNYTDKMSMASGVEVRVPLLDPELVSFAASLPVRFKQHGRTGKWIFKKAMEGVLPPEVIYRPKSGFFAPVRLWMKEGLSFYIDGYLSESSLQKRDLFDYTGVSRLLKETREGRIDGAYTIFSLICIELWCRLFLDR
ncbi:MAG: asparagine synthase (glutamine-hydrolyzing) [Candidatus Eremiobacteraeota bacterium]|nr:asparagine synthase (glutamine-hydrolyzing) [Candidatus Eremiobacteraeota bacterium]